MQQAGNTILVLSIMQRGSARLLPWHLIYKQGAWSGNAEAVIFLGWLRSDAASGAHPLLASPRLSVHRVSIAHYFFFKSLLLSSRFSNITETNLDGYSASVFLIFVIPKDGTSTTPTVAIVFFFISSVVRI